MRCLRNRCERRLDAQAPAAHFPCSRHDYLYLEFPGFDEASQRSLEQTYGANFDRLSQIGPTYEPQYNLRFNQNI